MHYALLIGIIDQNFDEKILLPLKNSGKVATIAPKIGIGRKDFGSHQFLGCGS